MYRERMVLIKRTLTVIAALFLAGCSVTATPGNFASTAEKYSGLHERENRKTLFTLIGVDPARVKWCGAFAGAVVRKSGHTPPAGHLRARSWSSFGYPVKPGALRRGDVVVMPHHVTFFTRKTPGRVCGIGGNQGNRVAESCYRTGRIIAYRRGR